MMSYPVVRAGMDLRIPYGDPQSLPTTFIYDRHGKRAHQKIGMLRAEQLEKLVEPLLAQN
jgi:hypothetical protein